MIQHLLLTSLGPGFVQTLQYVTVPDVSTEPLKQGSEEEEDAYNDTMGIYTEVHDGPTCHLVQSTRTRWHPLSLGMVH